MNVSTIGACGEIRVLRIARTDGERARDIIADRARVDKARNA